MARAIPLIFLLLLFGLNGCVYGAPMFIKKGEEVDAVLFSPLEGQLLYRGQPASGAVLSRWVAWKDRKGEIDTFEADEQGYFSIPKKTVRYRDNPLVQISIGQSVRVQYKGEEVEIWSAGKSSIHLYGELGGRPIELTCELTRTEMDHHLDFALVGTLCQWNDFEPVEE